MISSLIALCSTLTLLTVLSPILTLLILITAIPTVLVNKKFQNFLWNYDYLHSTIHRKAEYLYGVLASHAAVEELRINDAEQYFESQYKRSWKSWHDEKLRSSVRHNLHLFAANLLQILSMGLVFIYAIIRFLDKMISLGDIQFYVNISEQIKSNVTALFDASVDMQLNSEKISMFRNFMHWTPATLISGELAPSHLSEIEFSHVGFKYPGSDEWVLRDCSFVISPGKHIALVGLNGAGKSTIVKLLCRFYDVSEGAILIDGKNIKEYDTKKYRRNFTALFQETNTYSMTLLENITISDTEKFDENRLNYAIDFAGISNLLKEYTLHFPVTKVFSDNGLELSGGQKQKLALARAIYRNSAFVILDEPSSALDPEAEYSMMKKFIEMYNDKSALLISHRLANAALCDEIIVIDDRRICERGTHTHLMQLDGVYARLFRLQAERYLNDAEQECHRPL
jgi:ABC-type multidrug transport system fused ATPase/permease subunit